MAELPLDQAVPRFKANEDRLDTFVNSATGYTTSGGVSVQSIQEFLASIGSNGIDFVDNAKARFGTGTDLQIYHDASHSYIKDSGTGNLKLETTGGNISLLGGTENMVVATKDGSVSAYHNGSKKLETTSTGIDVIGLITTTNGYQFGTQGSYLYQAATDQVNIRVGDTGSARYFQFTDTSSGSRIGTVSGALSLGIASNDYLTIDTSGNVSIPSGNLDVTGTVEFDGLSGTGAVTITDIADEDNMASNSATKLATQQSIKAYVDAQVGTADTLSEVLGLGNTTGGTDIAVSANDDITFTDSSKAIFGASSDLQIYHDGSNSIIDESGTGSLYIRSNQVFIDKYTGERMIRAMADGQVRLFNDNVQRLNTNNVGVSVTGILDIFDNNSDISPDNSGSGQFRIDGNGYKAAIALDADGVNLYSTSATRPLIFGVNETEVARVTTTGIDVTGNVVGDGLTIAGDATFTGGGTGSIVINDEDSSLCPTMTFTRNGGGTTTNDFIKFENSGGEVATINSTGGAFLSALNVTGTVEFDGLSGTGSVTVTDILDEDDMTSDSATALATQQSIKAYVDANAGGSGDITAVVAGAGLTGGATSGSATLNVSHLPATDDRDMKPNTSGIGGTTNQKAIKPFFTSLGGMTGTADSDYQDALVLDTYSDTSGGNANCLIFDKTAGQFIIKHYNAAMTATTWGTPKTLAYSEDTLALSGGTMTGTLNMGAQIIDNVEDIVLKDRLLHHGDANNYFEFDTDVQYFVTNGSERMRIDSGGIDVTGAVSINASSAPTWDTDTHFWAESGFGVRYDGYQHRWDVGLTRTEAMRIDSSGNVGIATPAPTSKLHTKGSGVTGGIFVEDSSASHASPIIKVQGQRDDGNSSQSFSGGLALSRLRSQQLAGTNTHLGTLYFGTNHTDGTAANIAYSASIAAKLSGNANSATDMPTDLVFYTGSTGRALGTANVTYGTESMRIDSSGDVSIAGGDLNVTGNATATGTLKTTKSGTNQALFNATVDLGTNIRGFQLTSPSGDSGTAPFKWETGNSILWEIDGAASKSMFLNSSGNLGLGTYSQSAKLSVAGGVTVSSTIEVGSLTPAQDGAIEVGVIALGTPAISSTTSSTGLMNHIIFDNPNGAVGKINTLNSSTSYLTSSDYRLKTDVQAMTGSIDRVKALRPVNFEWIVDGTRVDGFLAHEAQEVVPEAVDGEKDAMRDQQYVESEATGDIYTPAVQATYETIQVELTPAVEAVYETVTVEISPAVEATYDEEGNELTPAVEAVTEEQEQLVTPAVDATYEEQQQELTPAIDEVIHSSDVVEPDELEEGQRWRETTEKVMATRQVPDYQGIDQSKLVPLLTSALQDAIAKIESLETRLEALEA